MGKEGGPGAFGRGSESQGFGLSGGNQDGLTNNLVPHMQHFSSFTS